MSEDNIEIVRAATAAFNADGVDGFLAFCDPEVEWRTTGRFADRGIYRGLDGVRMAFAEMQGEFDELRSKIDETWEAGDRVVASSRLSGRGSRSGVDVEQPLAYVIRLRAGKIVEVVTFSRTDEALEAAGVSA